jgi:ABC-2 type transport system ATP-binding protein
MDLLIAEKVRKQFAGHLALDDVSITVPEGSIFGLLGPNGAGKTTLIRIINNITAPDSGRLWFDGRPISTNDVNRIGYLPEERGLYKKMKIGEQAVYLAQLKGLKKADAVKALKEWFEKFDIGAWWDKKVEELSKGMQQKVQFIVTVLHNPRLLIFDEPFSGFDPINVNLLKDEILKIRNNGGTIIFSTHNMSSVEELCDHIALINNAVKILDGPMNDIRALHKENLFRLRYRNGHTDLAQYLPADYQLHQQNDDGNFIDVKIKIPAADSPNDLLNLAISHVEVHGFYEILPTMNDIFIKTVEASQKQRHHA